MPHFPDVGPRSASGRTLDREDRVTRYSTFNGGCSTTCRKVPVTLPRLRFLENQA